MSKDSGATAGAAASGRTGFILLALIVVFVFSWLYRHNPAVPAENEPEAAAPQALVDLAGFRADAWLLPDEELLGFVEVPAGEFIMGSDPLRDPLAYENERWSAGRRQGNPRLPMFYIGKYEVTVAQFNTFARASAGRVAVRVGEPGHPVADVTWTQALSYGRWLEGQLRDSPLAPPPIHAALAAGWRITLPSEAEWEKAARGTDGRIFPWGSTANEGNANFGGGAARAVTEGACPQCSYGLADMAGNVWEMTRSPLRNYPFNPRPFDPNDDAVDSGDDALFVMRGGSAADAANNVRAAVRGAVEPGVRNPAIGFRLAISPP